MTGTVMHWVSEKGYGFISPDAGNKDIFVHFRDIIYEGHRRELVKGQKVRFDVSDGKRGPIAVNVKVVGNGNS